MDGFLRVAEAKDAGQIAAIYRPLVESSAISFEYRAPSATEIRERMEAALADYPWLVWVRGSDVLGYAYAGPFRSRAGYQWSAEVTGYVRDDARGVGIGGALMASLLDVLAALGFVTAIAGIAVPNEASERLLAGLGFKSAGVVHRVGFKLGEWRDVAFWQLALSDPPETPEPPMRFSAYRSGPGLEFSLQMGGDSVL